MRCVFPQLRPEAPCGFRSYICSPQGGPHHQPLRLGKGHPQDPSEPMPQAWGVAGRMGSAEGCWRPHNSAQGGQTLTTSYSQSAHLGTLLTACTGFASPVGAGGPGVQGNMSGRPWEGRGALRDREGSLGQLTHICCSVLAAGGLAPQHSMQFHCQSRSSS